MSFVYKGLRATLEKVIVTDEEIDRQMLRLQEQAPRRLPVTDRAAEEGDTVILDYAGFCDGVQFPGGTAEKQGLELGSHTFIPGFEEQLVGANAGDDVTVKVTFPTEYHAAELAGKEAEFRCHIHEICRMGHYEMDDTFAKEVGGVETLADMKAKMGKELQDYYNAKSEAELQDRLLRQAAATFSYLIDPAEEDAGIEEQINALQAQLARRGLTLDAYCQFTGMTMQQLREDARAEAEQQIRMQKTVNEIALLESIKATDEEIDQQIGMICQENGMTREQLKPYMNDEFNAAVERSILTYKVMAFLRENAVVTETMA